MLPLPGEDKQVSSYFAFYIVATSQIGVGILTFQRSLVKLAGHDAWMSIFISAFAIHIIVWMTYQILIKGNNDITVIHRRLFGKWLGGLLSLLLILYMLSAFLLIMRSYIEVVQVWLFPAIQTWYLGIIIAILVYLYVSGGFRVVIGLSLVGFLTTVPLTLLNIIPLKEAQWSHLLPLLEHSFTELLVASKEMALKYSGFEVLFFCYPFLKHGPQSHKWAQIGVAFTSFIYLGAVLIALTYFSEGQLTETIWPTLTLWKVVDLTFIERFEYVGVAFWLFVILPNLCLLLWAATRGLKQLFAVQQKKSIVPLLILLICASTLVMEGQQVKQLVNWINKGSLFITFIYIPFIYVYQLIHRKIGGAQ